MNALQRLIESNAIDRLIRRDPSLFTHDIEQRQRIANRLGWTDLAERAQSRIPLAENLTRTLAEEGATDVVLLGMGGSSLSAIVFNRVIGEQPGGLRLHVLDTTCPQTVTALLESLDQSTTYFLLSSKSGTTIEPLSLYAIFRSWMHERLSPPEAGRHFIVITDPESHLHKLRQKEVLRLAVNAPPNVGGRFSALSVFGLVPAAMLGIDLKELVRRARDMESRCASQPSENPGALLAAWIADSCAQGRDKLTFISSPGLESFGLWVEQLVAESTGKEGKGVVPVIEPSPTLPSRFGPDRAIVVMRDASDAEMTDTVFALQELEHPLFDLVIEDRLEIGAEFVRWKYATALLGHLLDINPFDEPDVSAAKDATEKVLDGSISAPRAIADLEGVWPAYAGAFSGARAPDDLATALAPLAAAIGPGDYLGVLAYLPESDEHLAPLRAALGWISSVTATPTLLELGPRYLHSSGQLFKGGPDSGVFLVVTTRDRQDLPIPGKPYTLGALQRAQAEGDFIILASRDRRVMRLDLPDATPLMVGHLSYALRSAFG